MVDITLPYEFVGGTKAIANQVNANFETISRGFAGFNTELEVLKAEVSKFNKKPTRDSFDIVVSLLGKAPLGAFPLWTGEWIYNARTLFKEFWAKALEYKKAGTIRTLSTEEYDKEIEEYSETGAFVIDELNGHVRLPKITRFISGISELSELGKPANDTLQDHVHQVKQVNGVYGLGKGFELRGPLVDPETAVAPISTTKVDNSDEKVRVGSETAPKHVKLALYIQVANNTAEISTLDTKVIVEQLNAAIADLEADFSDKGTAFIALATEKVDLLNETAARNIGIIEEAGSEQNGLVSAEGAKQAQRVQAVGNNLQALGDAQVVRIETVVAEEVDKKLPEIAGKVDEIITEGNNQIARVAAAGNTQINLAEAQAQAAAASAGASASSAATAEAEADRAMQYVVKSSFGNIGDIQYTIRSDVPNGGVWCDGAEYTLAQFPDVYDLLAKGEIHSLPINEFDAQVLANGVCGYFGLDTENLSFKVPVLTDVYLKVGNGVPAFTAESLPNVTGKFGLKFVGENASTGTGALLNDKAGSPRAAGGLGSSGTNLRMDLSAGNSVYRDGAKVNPDHITYRAYVVLYSAAAEVSEVQAAEFINSLAGKANLDLANASLAHPQKFMKGLYSKYSVSGTNWAWEYFTDPEMTFESRVWCEQGGSVGSKVGAVAVIFLKPMKNTDYRVCPYTPFMNTGAGYGYYGIYNKSLKKTTGCTYELPGSGIYEYAEWKVEGE